jgi:hypothetical protein
MENVNNNPVAEEAVVETPAVETPVVETPVVEAPKVEETPAEPAKEEAPAEPAKTEEPKPETVINRPVYGNRPEVQALGSVTNGTIGATVTTNTPKTATVKESVKKETVALHSTKNVTWSGVGKVYRGYNIVDKEAAKQWLTRSHIRTATPEEVAKEFGK